jgi:hypothetical protein
VLFLASGLATYVTGQTVVVDDGYLYKHPMVMYAIWADAGCRYHRQTTIVHPADDTALLR